MKSFRTILVSALLAICTSASAQFTNNSSSTSSSDQSGWNTFYLQWNPGSYSVKHGDNQSYNGFSIGFNKAASITSSIPLFLEAGLGLQYTNYSFSGYGYDLSNNLVSLKIPVSVVYNFDIPNTTIAIAPFVGLDLRGNLVGWEKDDDETINLFSKDDMGDYAWKRFQIGWHIGVNAKFNNKFLVGVSYGTDFSEISENVKMGQASITLGFVY